MIGARGDGQLVNYRFRSPYYVVDRLFGAAELRLGGDKAQVVRIERIGDDVLLLLWRAIDESASVLRSSLWVRHGGDWVQRFHQCTAEG